jgi:hypothetical protein
MPRKEIQDVKVQLNENISPELDIKIQSQMKHRAAGDPAPEVAIRFYKKNDKQTKGEAEGG